MRDPLNGAKKASKFVTELMAARAAEVEKADKSQTTKMPDVSSFHEDAQLLYSSCMDGFEGADTPQDVAKQICTLSAYNFNERHPNGYAMSELDELLQEFGGVEKTVSTAGMSADLGTPSAEIALTDVGFGEKRRRSGSNR